MSVSRRLLCLALAAAAVLNSCPRALGQAGALDTAYLDPNVTGGTATMIAVEPNGKVIIAGTFTAVGGATHNRIARLNTNGIEDFSFTGSVTGVPATGTCTVLNLAIQNDGKMIVAGYFSTINGTNRPGMARFNSDGTLDGPYNPAPPATAIIYGVGLQPDGKVLVSGGFGGIGGINTDGIARLNVSGSADTTYSKVNFAGQEQGLVPVSDGKCITLGASTPRVLVRRNADGSRDTSFNALGTCIGETCATVQADGKILSYVEDNDFSGRLRRFFSDGSPDPSFDMGVIGRDGNDASINSICVQTDGKIIVAGTFSTVGGTTRNNIARLTETGTLDPTFNPNVNGTTHVMGAPDGKILICGSFSTVGGVNRRGVARLLNDPGTQTLSVPDSSTIRFMRSGGLPEYQDVVFELSTNGGSVWTRLATASRIPGGWASSGHSLPRNGMVRAIARIAGSGKNRTSGPAFHTASYSLPNGGIFALNLATVAGAAPITGTFSNWIDALGQIPFTYEVLIDGVSQGAPGAAFAIPLTAPETDGNHTVTGRIYNSAGGMTSVTQTFRVDAIPPLLSSVEVKSSNANSAWAGSGDSIFLTIRGNESLSAPAVTINGNAAIVTGNGSNWEASVPVTENMADGAAAFSIQYADLVGNFGVPVAGTTDASIVTVDRIAPLVTLTGGTPFIVEAGDNYVEPGATALDAHAGDVSNTVSIQGNVDTAVPGSYALQYSVNDLAGNVGTMTRTVQVVDTTAPSVSAPPAGFTQTTLVVGANGQANLPDFRSQLLATDIVGVTGISQTPEPGSAAGPGVVTVTLTARDAAGNTKSVGFNVERIDVTLPTIEAPLDDFTPLVIVTGENGSVPLPDYTTQAVTGDNVGVMTITQSPASGSARLAGTTMVTVKAADTAGNESSVSFDVTVADGTKPEINPPVSGFTPHTIAADTDGNAALPDYTAQAVTSDNVAVTSVTQLPAPGDVRLFGKTVVTLTVHDAAGNTRDTSFEVFVTLDAPLLNTLAGTGAPVPGAGVDPRIPADATFASVGLPAVDDERTVAFLATWKSSLGSGSGIFSGEPLALLVKAGEDAPGLPGVRFKTLQDPLISPDGSVAFGATLQGPGIKATNDFSAWLSVGATPVMQLREGSQSPGAPDGMLLKSAASMSLRNGELLVMGTLAPVPGFVTAANDGVLLSLKAAGGTVVFQEGSPIDLNDGQGPSAITKIESLLPATGSSAHGRWHADGAAIARLTLANKRVAVVERFADGTLSNRLAVGSEALNGTASWKVLGLPALEEGGSAAILKGQLTPKLIVGQPPTVTAKFDLALALDAGDGSGFQIIAREGSIAPNAGGATYASFLDPVVNDRHHALFVATLAGHGVTAANKSALYWGESNSLQLLARTGSAAPDAAGNSTGALWSTFVSYALPGGPDAGPVFVAKVAGTGVTAKNNMGLWAVDSTGLLRQLLRTGDLVGGKPVIGIQALSGTTASLGASRGYNAHGTVVTRVTFAKGGQSILRINIPEGKVRITSPTE